MSSMFASRDVRSLRPSVTYVLSSFIDPEKSSTHTMSRDSTYAAALVDRLADLSPSTPEKNSFSFASGLVGSELLRLAVTLTTLYGDEFHATEKLPLLSVVRLP